MDNTIKKRVLIFYPPNNRSIAIETMCKTIRDKGHYVFILSLTPKGPFHDIVEQLGITTYSCIYPQKPSWKFYLKQSRYLIRFCSKNKIDVVLSHLQANVIAVLSQNFLKAKVVVFRHHDETAFYAQYGKKFGMVRNKKEIMMDKFINRFAKQIAVLSNHVLNTMVVYEKCNPKKIVVCPLIYDFTRYPIPDWQKVEEIRQKMECRLLLIMVSRMTESKQHLPVLKIFNKLLKEGKSVKMIVMDDGPLREMIINFIQKHNLENDIMMPGYSTELVNYMAAADLLMHPSLTEASNNVVKEMALMEKGVAVCDGVGDFDDYIKPGINGYIMHRSDLEISIENVIRDAYNNPDKPLEMGKNLRMDVLKRFSDSAENKKRLLKLL